MRMLTLTSALIGCALLAACGGQQASQQNSTPATNSAQTSAPQNTGDASAPTVASSHGSSNTAPSSAPANGAAATDKAPVATPELDAKIEKTLGKANAKGASAADKKAAADAYKDRADFYYSAGDPRLYRYALGDYRRVLRFDPDNDEAKERVAYLIDIYHSMNRPVPDNGLEN
jgi:hypothetical protein